MKKLLYIFLGLSLMFGCSDDSNPAVDNPSENEEEEENTPISIRYTYEEVWTEGEPFNGSLDSSCGYNIKYTPEGGYGDFRGLNLNYYNHYSLDTLVLDISTPGWADYKGIFLGPLQSPPQQQSILSPEYIGHLELIGFDEESILVVCKDNLENWSDYTIKYLSSNVSQEFLNSITFKGCNNNQNYNVCPGDLVEIFVNADSSIKTDEVTVSLQLHPEWDDYEIGMVGSGFPGVASYDQEYKIIDKEYIY